ncbi:hypothetical protein TRAPUB_1385 [Trametes pubescens]|uniref:Uncharacterized protein n=1 Tax=Trametes pubescens TaxID=154538 RepID=A0A1M2VJH4_TRAPU|nr:hypothetical protein TRAPUB_1385 [Trametes pubescens]
MVEYKFRNAAQAADGPYVAPQYLQAPYAAEADLGQAAHPSRYTERGGLPSVGLPVHEA